MREPQPSVLSRLANVITGLDDRAGTPDFVVRLAALVEETGCCLEGFRAPGGEWFTVAGSVGPDALEGAVAAGPQGSSAAGGLTISLPGRPWARAFPVSGPRAGAALLVVSAPGPPRRDVAEGLRSLALGVRLAHAAWLTEAVDCSSRSPRAQRATLREAREAQWRLTATAADGGGLAGIASTLSQIVGRSVRIWDPTGRRLAEQPAEGGGAPPDPGLTSLTSGGHEPWRHGEWWCADVSPDGHVLGVVGIHDPDGVAGEADHLALEQAAVVVALELYRLRSVARAEVRLWGGLAAELLLDDDRARARSHAEALGYDLDRPHQVALARNGVPTAELLDAVTRTLRSREVEGLATAVGTGVGVIAPGEPDWNTFAEALAARVGPVRIGVGRRAGTGRDLDRHLREAELALSIGAAVGSGDVVWFDDLGLYRLLAIAGNPEELHRYVAEWLGPLLAYDREHGSELVRTLATYLESGCSLERAAKALFIHRSTLKYRLARAGELLGKDLTDPDVRFHLQLAARTITAFEALNTETSAARFGA